MPLLSEFPVAGPSGDGSGDMLAQIYDPTGQRRDIFGAFANRTLSNLTNPQQALANLGAGVRPNLADNCDFTNPVNTVGFTSGTYSNDFSIFNRWKVQGFGNSITATLTATGLQVNTTASNQGIRQTIDAKNFSAQLYTSSVIIDGVLYSAQFPKPTGSGVIIQYPGSNYYFAITPYGDAWFWYPFVEYQAEPMEVTISHCKLEEGEGQTLAYEDADGAWQLLPQPDMDYETQLAKCQRYGLFMGNSEARASRITQNVVRAWFPTPTPLRTNPVLASGNFQVKTLASGNIMTGALWSFETTGCGVTVTATLDSHGVTDATIFSNNAFLSAEL